MAARDTEAVPVDRAALPVIDLSNLREGMPDYDTPELRGQWEREGLAVLKRVGELGVFRAMSVGTRQMLFQSARAIGARSVLDIGTYVGTSALAFALAVERVVTVDYVDANAPDGYWKIDGRTRSPAGLMEAAGVADRVEFVTATDANYLAGTDDRFDLICIDASKDSEEDYLTTGLALKRLNPGGLMFFDDVFPEGKPMKAGGYSVLGPWLMLERLKRESGAKVHQIDKTIDGGDVRCAFMTR